MFVRQQCGDCHRVAALSQAQGTLAPTLDGLSRRAGARVPGQAAEAYVRLSVESPDAHVVRGYLNAMPALRDKMSDQEYEDLIAWLMTL